MSNAGHISLARTTVRGNALTRHTAISFEDGVCYAVSSGLGLPRTWGLSTKAVLDGFANGLRESAGQDSGHRLRTAVGAARSTLADRCDQLVERLLPDATLVALLIADGALHVMSAGPGRVYIQRSGKPKRLTARDEGSGGLLRARPSVCSAPLQAGDLVLAGSVTAFSMTAIAKVMTAITNTPTSPPSTLAALLTEPAATAGAGAAAVVVRFA